jgi:UDP-glucose 4-epimerase
LTTVGGSGILTAPECRESGFRAQRLDWQVSSVRALITGGAGFIGSHLADALLRRGYDICIYDDFSTGRRENVAHLEGHAGVRVVVGSVLERDALRPLVEQCDVIFHMAAAVGVRLIVNRPLHSLLTNIHGAANVLEFASEGGKKTLVASSSEVYGKSEACPFREDADRVLGSTTVTRWLYSTTKAADEFLALAYARERGLPVVIARLFNVVGPRQSAQYGMVVPTFVRQALRGEPLTVYGDGRQTRCFACVYDVVDALVDLMRNPEAEGEIFNVGSDEEISIRQLAERVIAATGSSAAIRFVPYDEAFSGGFEDMRRRVPDIAKLRALTGYRPQYDLDRTIEAIIEHVRSQECSP